MGAIALLERAVELGKINLAEDDPDVLRTSYLLGQMLRKDDDLSGARRVLEDAYAAGLWRLGDSDALMLEISHDIGVVAEELGNRHEARKAFGRVAELGPAALGAGHWAVARARAYLGQETEAGVRAEEVVQPPAAPVEEATTTLPIRPVAAGEEPTAAIPLPPAGGSQVQPPTPANQQHWPAPAAPEPARSWPEQPPAWEAAPPTETPTWPGPTQPHGPAAQPPQWAAPAQPQGPEAQWAGSAQTPAQGVPPPQRGGQAPEAQWAGSAQTPAQGVPPQWAGAAQPYPQEAQAPHWTGAPQPYAQGKPQPTAKRSLGIFAAIAAVLAAVIAVSALVFVLANRSGDKPDSNVPTLGGKPPTDVVLKDQGARIRVSWADPAGGKVSFLVAMARPGQQLKPVSTLGPGTTSFEIGGLNANLNYCFAVVAVYRDNKFATSQQACTNRSTSTK